MPMGIVPLAAPDANGYDKRFVAPKKTITCYICGREVSEYLSSSKI